MSFLRGDILLKLHGKVLCCELPFTEMRRSHKFAGLAWPGNLSMVRMVRSETMHSRHLHLLGFPVWGDRAYLSGLGQSHRRLAGFSRIVQTIKELNPEECGRVTQDRQTATDTDRLRDRQRDREIQKRDTQHITSMIPKTCRNSSVCNQNPDLVKSQEGVGLMMLRWLQLLTTCCRAKFLHLLDVNETPSMLRPFRKPAC